MFSRGGRRCAHCDVSGKELRVSCYDAAVPYKEVDNRLCCHGVLLCTQLAMLSAGTQPAGLQRVVRQYSVFRAIWNPHKLIHAVTSIA